KWFFLEVCLVWPQEDVWYGQEYRYVLENGECSGVAAYEPGVGNDENACHKPVFYDINILLRPDETYFQEEPFGEMFFPSPVVGYSRVEVKELGEDNVTQHGTGKTVYEFYTAADFPAVTGRTTKHLEPQKNAFNLLSLLKLNVRDHMT